jgi:hypothetical protein
MRQELEDLMCIAYRIARGLVSLRVVALDRAIDQAI